MKPPSYTALRILKTMYDGGMQWRSGSEIVKASLIKPGSVYPILHKHEARGHLTSFKEEGDPIALARPLMTLYSLTPAGKKYYLAAVKAIMPKGILL